VRIDQIEIRIRERVAKLDRGLMKINMERLRATFEVSSSIGRTDRGGLHRLALSREDKEMRDIFCGWLEDAGLKVRVDDIGNIYGRREGKNPEAGVVMTGSHLDTQPKGGRFDGILGVLAALEAVRTLNDYGVETERPIEIVNFTCEESGRFAPPMQGSGVVTGHYDKMAVYNNTDRDGFRFEDCLTKIGYKGGIEHRLSNVKYYVELHIEQGPVLESAGVDIGVVLGVKGTAKFKVTVTGQSTHGAHPTQGRRDPLVAASEMVLAINRMAYRHEDFSTMVGVFEVRPSVTSISPRQVEFIFDIRHFDDDLRYRTIDALKEEMRKIASERNVEVLFEQIWDTKRTAFSPEVLQVIEEGAAAFGYSTKRMTSSAGHDAQFMNSVALTGMLFAPSIGGLSHCEEELTDWEDIEKAANVLLYTVRELADRRDESQDGKGG